MTPTARCPSTPSDAASAVSQRFTPSPHDQTKRLQPNSRSGDRCLPSRNVTNGTLDDAYVAFIQYCNPVVSLSADSTELRKIFRAPPRSDGKCFSTYTLLELIRKLEHKEIKTWTQLAIQLGVEPPIAEKGQSTQKVQQEADLVRFFFQRWMHAMHIDAFFEYCLGKPHAYYTDIPPLHAPYPEFGRDGVPFEEDLALRALHPESRPKRGRRRTDEKDGSLVKDPSPIKRPRLDTSAATMGMDGPGSAHPAVFQQSGMSSAVDELARYAEQDLDPWTAAPSTTSGSQPLGGPNTANAHSAVTPSGAQVFRWRLNTREVSSPMSAYPQSAVTPSSTHPPDSGFDEPQSAITPSSSGGKQRARRRHGPAVSSAWPSSGNPVTGKLRGRPPSNRSVRDGPFSTFPANPKLREGPLIDLQASTPFSTPTSARAETNELSLPGAHSTPSVPSKPSGLHLQVPQHIGGTVRLATPTVLVNGAVDEVPRSDRLLDSDPVSPHASDNQSDLGETILDDPNFDIYGKTGEPHRTVDMKDFVRLLASHLSRATVSVEATGTTLDIHQMSPLAEGVVRSLGLGTPSRDGGTESLHRDEILNQYVMCLGFPDLLRRGMIKPLPFRARSEGFMLREETPVPGTNASRTTPSKTHHPSTYVLTWTFHHGPLAGEMSLPNIHLPSPLIDPHVPHRPLRRGSPLRRSEEPEPSSGSDDPGASPRVDWKAKYWQLKKEKAEEMERMRRRIWEAVL
ncbi:MAG: hypothetical protein M1817_004499 [Caeruleum heppii]|nr:MAG: hypothetical protein M1817_004499 [Caeruleum heppii]